MMPKKNGPAVRWSSRKDSKSVFQVASKFLESNAQPTHIIAHCGYEECMEFDKERFLTEVRAFSTKLSETRPNCSWSIVTIPQFHKECRDANENLKELQEELKFDLIDLKHAQRAMALKGDYS